MTKLEDDLVCLDVFNTEKEEVGKKTCKVDGDRLIIVSGYCMHEKYTEGSIFTLSVLAPVLVFSHSNLTPLPPPKSPL